MTMMLCIVRLVYMSYSLMVSGCALMFIVYLVVRFLCMGVCSCNVVCIVGVMDVELFV